MSNRFYNYILYNVNKPTITYNGYTVNLQRRIRQHNNEIKGGARATVMNSPGWQYLAVISCPTFTKNTAMQVEWYIKHPTCKIRRPKEFNGPIGRLKSLPLVFCNSKFRDMEFTVRVCDKYYETAKLYYDVIPLDCVSTLTQNVDPNLGQNIELLENIDNSFIIDPSFTDIDVSNSNITNTFKSLCQINS